MADHGLLRLSAWEHPTRQYLFDAVTGQYRKVHNAAPHLGAAGCAAEVKVGFRLGNRPTKLVAVYTDGTRLLLSVGDRTIDLEATGLRTARKVTGPFARRFLVTRDDRELLSVPFVATFAEGDPFKGDIFDYIEHATKSRTALLRTLYSWCRSQQGHDISKPGFFDGLDAFLEEHGS
jgi:hypothetical protein